MLRKNNQGQSILEYAVLLGVVVSAIMVMQMFVKRGFSGNLKDAADRMGGDTFSAGGTSIEQKRTLEDDQKIIDEVATTNKIGDFFAGDIKGTVDKGVYSFNERTGGTATVETKSNTDSSKKEKTRWSDYQDEEASDFPEPF